MLEMLPLPVADPASLEKLDLETYDALAEAVGEHMKLIKGKQNPTKASAS